MGFWDALGCVIVIVTLPAVYWLMTSQVWHEFFHEAQEWLKRDDPEE